MTASGPLAGRRIGILQARHGRELAALIEREGGRPVHAPCLREVRDEPDDQRGAGLAEVLAGPVHAFVFQTGVGTRALFELAAERGVAQGLTASVRGALVLARGPKPLAALLERGLPVHRRTAEPHTTREVIALLAREDLAGRRTAVQHYGSANEALVGHLRQRGAQVIELSSYRWALPADVTPILRLLDDLAAGRVDVMAFTSAAQVENLFTLAADAGCGPELPGWLNERAMVAAIGPACAAALESRGVRVALQPPRPKMVPFVRAIGEAFASSRASWDVP